MCDDITSPSLALSIPSPIPSPIPTLHPSVLRVRLLLHAHQHLHPSLHLHVPIRVLDELALQARSGLRELQGITIQQQTGAYTTCHVGFQAPQSHPPPLSPFPLPGLLPFPGPCFLPPLGMHYALQSAPEREQGMLPSSLSVSQWQQFSMLMCRIAYLLNSLRSSL